MFNFKGRPKTNATTEIAGPIITPSSTSTTSANPNPSNPNNAVAAQPTYNAFGTPINPSGDGPSILGKFIRFLQTKAINAENLFATIPELDNEVQVVKKNILREMATYGGDNDALQLSSYTKNPLVVAELLKHYLASLPEPLLTFQLYDSFLLTQTVQTPTDRIWAYRFLLAYLPPGFRASVKQLLTLLFNLSRNSEINGMDANALASVFATYLLRAEEDLYYMQEDQPVIVQIVALLIQEYESVLRAAPTGTTSRSQANIPATSFASIATVTPVAEPAAPQAQQVLPPHPLDLSAAQPASLYDHPNQPPSQRASQRLPSQPSSRSATQSPTQQITQSPQTTPQPLTHLPSLSKLIGEPDGAALRRSGSDDGQKEGSDGADIESETVLKLGKLRENVLVVLDDQITATIVSLINTLMTTTNTGEVVAVSTSILNTKKALSDQILQTLSADKHAIAAFIAANPKPPLSVPPSIPFEDTRFNDLRAQTITVTEQLMELLHFLKVKMSSMNQPTDLPVAIAIAQVAKNLKATITEQVQRVPGSVGPISPTRAPPAPSFSSPQLSPFSSPPSGPSFSPPNSSSIPPNSRGSVNLPRTTTPAPLVRTASQGGAGMVAPGAQVPGGAQARGTSVRGLATSRELALGVIDREVATTKRQLEIMVSVLPTIGQNELVEFAKGIRYVKQIVNEHITQMSLSVDPEIYVEQIEGEDQLSKLRRTLDGNITKLNEQLEAILGHVHSPAGQQVDQKALSESLTVLTRALANTHPSLVVN